MSDNQNRLRTEYLAMIENYAAESLPKLATLIAFLEGVRFADPQSPIARHFDPVVSIGGDVRQIQYLAGCLRKDQGK